MNVFLPALTARPQPRLCPSARNPILGPHQRSPVHSARGCAGKRARSLPSLTWAQLRGREQKRLTDRLHLLHAGSDGWQTASQQVKGGRELRSLRIPRSAQQKAEREGTRARPPLLSPPWHSPLEKQTPARLTATGSLPLPKIKLSKLSRSRSPLEF